MATEERKKSFCDYVGDCALAALDEGKFWIEVFTEFMEWDEEGQQRHAERQLEQLRKSMPGTQPDKQD